MNNIIYFATSNSQKFTSLKSLLVPLGIDLRQLEYDFDEGRDLDIRKLLKRSSYRLSVLFQASD